jgi:hypothetical protein
VIWRAVKVGSALLGFGLALAATRPSRTAMVELMQRDLRLRVAAQAWATAIGAGDAPPEWAVSVLRDEGIL